jgi:glycosyltransferase involved in cell wall biosynthesis
VVLPVWNGERFLAEAIESVTAQTLVAFELLIVNDGSTDRTDEIAAEAARNDPRIIVLNRPHGGIAEALNTGIEMARADYVARMDADDVALPSRLEKQIAFLNAHPECVLVGTDVDVIDVEGEAIGVMTFPAHHQEIVQALITGASPAVAHPAIMMRKGAVLAAGGYRQEHVPAEDLDLWLRLVDFGQMANLKEPLLRYRMHPSATSIRDGNQQQATSVLLRAAARARRGLPMLHRSFGHVLHRNAVASFHYECVRTALSSKNRTAVIKHARASIRRAPGWWRPYVALALSALPPRGIAMLLKIYTRLRN